MTEKSDRNQTNMNAKAINRIIISGGGTGGHIFPAIAIADEIKRKYPDCQILFVGAEGRMEMERVPHAGYEIVGLPIKGFNRKNLIANVRVLVGLMRSILMARRIVRRFRPDIVVGVGGYASAPTLRAAQSLGIPTLIQEQNSYAGVTNKLLSKRADCICVAYPEMEHYFPADKIVMTGNPIRPDVLRPMTDRAVALAHFGLRPNTRSVLLVVGGSLGAHTINKSVSEGLQALAQAGIALIWQTGKLYISEGRRQAKAASGLEVYVADFIDRMDYAYGLADLVISRSGACSVSELCLLSKPTILVPSPNVAEDHQTKNATALSLRSAAILVTDDEAPESLINTAIELVKDSARLQQLSTEVARLAEPHAARRIVEEIERII